eukprot:TRINITY_DN1959_c0_g1_i1.p1 TRINITY_DN1959_c0_g1~~TRINITY_DN1959_c0_g1_i1.p1  ORF type:complete len:145 (+),score=12.38 TRINITY_DN1959_c0_g1_i1:555-989(+)
MLQEIGVSDGKAFSHLLYFIYTDSIDFDEMVNEIEDNLDIIYSLAIEAQQYGQDTPGFWQQLLPFVCKCFRPDNIIGVLRLASERKFNFVEDMALSSICARKFTEASTTTHARYTTPSVLLVLLRHAAKGKKEENTKASDVHLM